MTAQPSDFRSEGVGGVPTPTIVIGFQTITVVSTSLKKEVCLLTLRLISKSHCAR